MSTEIRVARPEDAGRFLEIYGPVVRETAISFEEEVPTREEMAARIEGTLTQLPWLTLYQDRPEGEFIDGYAYASPFRVRRAYRWSVEVTVYIAPEARGRRYGRALYRVLLELLRDLGYCNAFAGIGLPNDKSVALHEALGFERLGVYRDVGFKHGSWHDVGWWQLRLGPLPEAPSEPKPFPELRWELDWPRYL